MVFDNLVGVSYKGLPGKKDMRSLKSLWTFTWDSTEFYAS